MVSRNKQKPSVLPASYFLECRVRERRSRSRKAQMLISAQREIHESLFALKLAFVLCDFAIVFLLLDILKNSSRGAHLVFAYSWKPLLAIEVAGVGDISIVCR